MLFSMDILLKQCFSVYGIFSYTQSADKRILYALVLAWPKENVLKLGSPRLKAPNVTMLGYGALEVRILNGNIVSKDA